MTLVTNLVFVQCPLDNRIAVEARYSGHFRLDEWRPGLWRTRNLVGIVTIRALYMLLHRPGFLHRVVYTDGMGYGVRRNPGKFRQDVRFGDGAVVTGQTVILLGSVPQQPLSPAGGMGAVAGLAGRVSNGPGLDVFPSVTRRLTERCGRNGVRGEGPFLERVAAAAQPGLGVVHNQETAETVLVGIMARGTLQQSLLIEAKLLRQTGRVSQITVSYRKRRSVPERNRVIVA